MTLYTIVTRRADNIPREKAQRDSWLSNQSLTRKTVISCIRKYRVQLTKLDVKSLSIFGSAVRGEERPDSDVDILVEFEGRATFDRYKDAKFYLAELLGCKADLVVP